MWYLLVSFVLLLMSIYLGIEVSKVPNYVLITYHHWMIETSLWVAVLCLLVLFFVLYWIIRFLARTATAAKRYHYWRMSRRHRKARTLTQRGLCELAEGDWSQAEEILVRAAKLSKKPLIDYLSAARAAQAQQAFERRDNYLRLAHHADKNATIAIGLTQAQLQIDGKQWEQALATLQHLYQRAPTHCYILKLLASVFVELNEWKKCENLLPLLKKYRAIPEKELQQLERNIYLTLLDETRNKESSILTAFWKSLPRHYKQEMDFIMAYVNILFAKGLDEMAMEQIEHSIKKEWNAKLITLYGQVRDGHTTHQLPIAEHWLKKHPHDLALLLCLSHLCMREKLWGKAQDYLQQSIAIKPSATAYIKLANLYEMLNENQKAQQCFRTALNLTRTEADGIPHIA
ncbi:MAG: hypothetical protein A3F41_04610 [Coxiella sp. RIFCSPHIGHO2_12_FULL_44_14]|nr:MAG: hypothetical protein A3F41_04610 [Coxiella sp. RIFCSPHIGHO2_12_FULL_44_14]